MPTTKIDGYIREPVLKAWLGREFGDEMIEGEVVWQVTVRLSPGRLPGSQAPLFGSSAPRRANPHLFKPLSNGETGWSVDAPRYIAEVCKVASRPDKEPWTDNLARQKNEKTALRRASLPQRRRVFAPSPVTDG